MPATLPPRSSGLHRKALLVLVVALTLLFGVVVWPLGRAVAWAIFIAIVFASWQERAVASLRGRRNWAAFATLLAIVFSVILPMVLLGGAIAQEASAFYQRIQAGELGLGEYFDRAVAALPEWLRAYLARIGLDELGTVQRKIVDLIGRRSQEITAQAFTVGQGTLDLLLNLFVMIYLLFFLLRDGNDLAAKVELAMPLEPRHNRRLLNEFAVVVRATVKGNVAVALVQGALGWLAFWFLGIHGALLWGAVMALLSLLPAVGAALVWGPVAIWLIGSGSVWSGVGLIAWGALVIGLVDNVLRPVLVGKEARMPDYLVLVATLGGLAIFGATGFVVGPVVAALFLATWQVFGEMRGEALSR